ncbi:MAG: restriction endonuclease subunit S [Accumulibacter sp.]|jgi:type I restriction enzyme S subunit
MRYPMRRDFNRPHEHPTVNLPDHLDLIAAAPAGIQKLRGLILELAVRGKLVPQEPNDELEMTDGEDANPFSIPGQWKFVRLGQVLEMVNGRAFKPTEWLAQGLPIVRIQNLNNLLAPFNYCDPETVADRHFIRNDDLLISWSGTPGTSFGAFIWNRGLAALNQHIFRCVQIGQSFSNDFLRLAINSQLSVLISKAQGGVGLQHVTKGTLEALPLPLPPLM